LEFCIRHFNELCSTNLYARELLDNGDEKHGTVITTNFQTSGLGQGNNIWTSEKDQNLLLSLIIHPEFLLSENVFILSQIAAISLQQIVTAMTECNEVRIKWPNDIYTGDRKVAGILINNDLEQDMVRASVIGIGLNVNQDKFPDTVPNPVSLKMVTGQEHDLNKCLQGVLEEFSDWYHKLENGQFTLIQNKYKSLLYKFGEELTFQRNDNTLFKGRIRGVDQFGMLQIESEGRVLKFDVKEISYPVI
jgi:BirA family transcriptional regulator, biotin operon repressor / biotin---[acetyl-CoA-carboxylase] ligase